MKKILAVPIAITLSITAVTSQTYSHDLPVAMIQTQPTQNMQSQDKSVPNIVYIEKNKSNTFVAKDDPVVMKTLGKNKYQYASFKDIEQADANKDKIVDPKEAKQAHLVLMNLANPNNPKEISWKKAGLQNIDLTRNAAIVQRGKLTHHLRLQRTECKACSRINWHSI